MKKSKSLTLYLFILLLFCNVTPCKAKVVTFQLDKKPKPYVAIGGSATSLTDNNCKTQHFSLYKKKNGKYSSIAILQLTKSAFPEFKKGMIIPVKYTNQEIDCYNSDQYFYISKVGEHQDYKKTIKNNQFIYKALRLVLTQLVGYENPVNFEGYEPGYVVVKSIENGKVELETSISFPRTNSYISINKCNANLSGSCTNSKNTKYKVIYKPHIGIKIEGSISFTDFFQFEDSEES